MRLIRFLPVLAGVLLVLFLITLGGRSALQTFKHDLEGLRAGCVMEFYCRDRGDEIRSALIWIRFDGRKAMTVAWNRHIKRTLLEKGCVSWPFECSPEGHRIYYLFHKGVLVYIGSTTQIWPARILQHIAEGRKSFDEVWFREVEVGLFPELADRDRAGRRPGESDLRFRTRLQDAKLREEEQGDIDNLKPPQNGWLGEGKDDAEAERLWRRERKERGG